MTSTDLATSDGFSTTITDPADARFDTFKNTGDYDTADGILRIIDRQKAG